MEYKFIHNNKDYVLSEENCEGLFFEDSEIEGCTLKLVLDILNNSNEVTFSKEYYADKCICNQQEKINKAYCYLEYHFYIYTKNCMYIINTISEEYRNTSFNKLLSLGEIDNSYIINVTVCPNCGKYSIDVIQCEV